MNASGTSAISTERPQNATNSDETVLRQSVPLMPAPPRQPPALRRRCLATTRCGCMLQINRRDKTVHNQRHDEEHEANFDQRVQIQLVGGLAELIGDHRRHGVLGLK